MMKPPKIVEKTKQKVKHNYLRYGVVAGTALTAVLVKDIEGVRDNLPEPWDVPDHLGNVNISLQAGYISGLFAGVIYSRYENEQGSTPVEARRKTRTIMALAGFCVRRLDGFWPLSQAPG